MDCARELNRGRCADIWVSPHHPPAEKRVQVMRWDVGVPTVLLWYCFTVDLYCVSCYSTVLQYRVGHKSLTTLCKSQSMRNRWITTICDPIRPRGKSLGGATLTVAIMQAAILDSGRTF